MSTINNNNQLPQLPAYQFDAHAQKIQELDQQRKALKRSRFVSFFLGESALFHKISKAMTQEVTEFRANLTSNIKVLKTAVETHQKQNFPLRVAAEMRCACDDLSFNVDDLHLDRELVEIDEMCFRSLLPSELMEVPLDCMAQFRSGTLVQRRQVVELMAKIPLWKNQDSKEELQTFTALLINAVFDPTISHSLICKLEKAIPDGGLESERDLGVILKVICEKKSPQLLSCIALGLANSPQRLVKDCEHLSIYIKNNPNHRPDFYVNILKSLANIDAPIEIDPKTLEKALPLLRKFDDLNTCVKDAIKFCLNNWTQSNSDSINNHLEFFKLLVEITDLKTPIAEHQKRCLEEMPTAEFDELVETGSTLIAAPISAQSKKNILNCLLNLPKENRSEACLRWIKRIQAHPNLENLSHIPYTFLDHIPPNEEAQFIQIIAKVLPQLTNQEDFEWISLLAKFPAAERLEVIELVLPKTAAIEPYILSIYLKALVNIPAKDRKDMLGLPFPINGMDRYPAWLQLAHKVNKNPEALASLEYLLKEGRLGEFEAQWMPLIFDQGLTLWFKLINEINNNLDNDVPIKFHVMLMSFMQQNEAYRLLTYRHLHAKIAEAIRECDKSIIASIINKANLLLLHNEHPIYQKALEAYAQMDVDESNPKNPWKLHQKLKTIRETEDLMPVGPKVELVLNGDLKADAKHPQVALNLQGFRKRAENKGHTYKDLPRDHLPTGLDALFNQFEQRLKTLDASNKEAVAKAIGELCEGTNLATLKDETLGLGKEIPKLLHIIKAGGDPKAPVENSAVYLYEIMKAIEGESNEVPPNALLSPQEQMFLKFLSMVRACEVGQRDAIAIFYNHLPLKHKGKASTNAVDKVEGLMEQAVQRKLIDTFSNESSLTAISGKQLRQTSHQTLFLQNRYGHQLGLIHHLKFEPYAQVIDDDLIATAEALGAKEDQAKKAKEILGKILEQIPPQELIKMAKQEIAAGFKEHAGLMKAHLDAMTKYENARKKHDGKGTTPELEALKAEANVLKDKVKAYKGIKYDDLSEYFTSKGIKGGAMELFEFEEDADPYYPVVKSISNKGALELMKGMGYLIEV